MHFVGLCCIIMCPCPTAALSAHSSQHNTYYVAPELNIQHNLNQQAHNTTNNTEWNQPLTPSYLLQCWTPYAVVHNLHSWRLTYRCPKRVELFRIINHNCCIKLVPLVIFIYDARSHIHQIFYWVVSGCATEILTWGLEERVGELPMRKDRGNNIRTTTSISRRC